MTRNMTITIECDGNDCLGTGEIEIDLSEGDWTETSEMKIEHALKRARWYSNYDGDYCPKCADQAKKIGRTVDERLSLLRLPQVVHKPRKPGVVL